MDDAIPHKVIPGVPETGAGDDNIPDPGAGEGGWESRFHRLRVEYKRPPKRRCLAPDRPGRQNGNLSFNTCAKLGDCSRLINLNFGQSHSSFMSDAPSIGVLIPTRNCASLLPGHIRSLMAWIDLAEEIIVVDSDSRDGTVELLRAGLSHPRVKFLTHPPGLYQSWNFGIQNVSAKYIYVATVGDPIERRGIQHLYDVAETFQSDVVISKPRFISEAGEPLPDDRWPIDVILERLRIQRPELLTTAEQFLIAVTNTWGAQDAGLDRKTALTAASHALAEAILYWRESGESLSKLLQEAATPGGTTAATLAAMDAAGYKRVIECGLAGGIRQAQANARH